MHSQPMDTTFSNSEHRAQQHQPYMQEPNPYGTIPYQNQMPPQGMKEYHSEPQHFGSAFPQGSPTECTTCCVFEF